MRGDLADPELDIPAGGEVSLLTAKRRASISEGSARRPRPSRPDDAFDPEVVQQNSPLLAEPAAPKQTASAVLGSWIKSVGTLLKQDVTPTTGGDTDSGDDELHARLQRKAERAERRAARAARRAARQAPSGTETEATQARTTVNKPSATELSAPEAEGGRRSSRRIRREEDVESRRPAEPEQPTSPPARPALRERAMSLSATLDSGFKNLRDSVNKIVAGPKDQSEEDSASSEEDAAAAATRTRRRQRSRSRRRYTDSDEDPVPVAPRQPGNARLQSRSGQSETEDARSRRREGLRGRDKIPNQKEDSQDGPGGERRSQSRKRHGELCDNLEPDADYTLHHPIRSERYEPEDARKKRRERSRRREKPIPEESTGRRVEQEGRSFTRSLTRTPLAPHRTNASDDAAVSHAWHHGHEASNDGSKSKSFRTVRSTSRAARQTRPSRMDSPPLPIRTESRSAATTHACLRDASTSDSKDLEPPKMTRRAPDQARGEDGTVEEARGASSLPVSVQVLALISDWKPLAEHRSSKWSSPTEAREPEVRDDGTQDHLVRRQVEPCSAPSIQRSPSPVSPVFCPASSSSVRAASGVLQQAGPSAQSFGTHGDTLTDEEESRFDARPSRLTRSRTRDDDGGDNLDEERMPPIPIPIRPAPSRMSPAGYHAAPLRPLPLHVQPAAASSQGARHGDFDAAPRGPPRGGPYDSAWPPSAEDHPLSLSSSAMHPHAGSFSSSQAALEPSSDELSDSNAAETSEPDSVAFRRPPVAADPSLRSGQFVADQGRRSSSSFLLRHGGSADEDILPGRHYAHPATADRPPPDSNLASPASASCRRGIDAATLSGPTRTTIRASPVRKSRTTVGPPPASGAPAVGAVDERSAAPASTRYRGYGQGRGSPYVDSDARLSSAPPSLFRTGGLASPVLSTAASSPLTGGGDSTARDPTTGASRSFERWTANGRESGSVQLFGRHGAPVSRRTARRLGMQ